MPNSVKVVYFFLGHQGMWWLSNTKNTNNTTCDTVILDEHNCIGFILLTYLVCTGQRLLRYHLPLSLQVHLNEKKEAKLKINKKARRKNQMCSI